MVVEGWDVRREGVKGLDEIWGQLGGKVLCEGEKAGKKVYIIVV